MVGGMERGLSARRKWWLLAFVVLAAWVVGLIGLASRDPFPFIAQYDGKRILNPFRRVLALDIEPIKPAYYAFDADPSEIEAAVKLFAQERGWTDSGPNMNHYADWAKYKWGESHTQVRFTRVSELDGAWKDAFILPEGTTCFVAVRSELSWLDRQLAAVRGWFGR